MYAFSYPANVAKVVVSPLWTLGEILFTDGVVDHMDEFALDIGYFLMRHLAGDYGLLYLDELDRCKNDEARRDGRGFTSLFAVEDCTLKIVTIPSLNRTVVCLARED